MYTQTQPRELVMAGPYAQFLIVELLRREDQRENIRNLRIERRILRDTSDPFSLNEIEFIANFRLNKEAARNLINELIPYTVHSIKNIPLSIAVFCTLSFLGHGSYQRNVGNSMFIALSQPSVSRCIKKITLAIATNLMRQWIRLPQTNEQRAQYRHAFQRKYRMPNILGAVDGTHVGIVKPQENENTYVNRKGYHSINVQIICDSTLKIINVVARYPGSSHDSFVWRYSRVAHVMKANYENGDHISKLIGDSGYPCLPWLLVPLRNPNTPAQVRFNNTFKTTRSCVECCIGILKGRFRCLLKDRILHYTPGNASRIVMACAILHNIVIHYKTNDNVQPHWDDIDLQPIHHLVPEHGDLHYRNLGQLARNQYIENNFHI
ncbi:hypothetical protein MML48_1g02985 [Holotrichia oblita]|uniref:Uncharacterized protein n=1 Tax=Holotrichia oblita TaxID=644536 RepID=A0ACB9TSP3_HOLOL|nr:hypothetical protein MML48_1g02985 [Holotrichia oblita]